MKNKKANDLIRVELPQEIAAAGYSAADSRCASFIRHWASMQEWGAKEYGSQDASIQQLTRNVYLQGVWDGFQLGEKRALEGTFMGEGIS